MAESASLLFLPRINKHRPSAVLRKRGDVTVNEGANEKGVGAQNARIRREGMRDRHCWRDSDVDRSINLCVVAVK